MILASVAAQELLHAIRERGKVWRLEIQLWWWSKGQEKSWQQQVRQHYREMLVPLPVLWQDQKHVLSTHLRLHTLERQQEICGKALAGFRYPEGLSA